MDDMCKSARELRADRRRRQVLDAAGACFREEGFHGASMSRIAARADMSVGHIYRYFDSKDAIIIALVQRDCAQVEASLRRMIASAGNVETIITRLRKSIPWMLDRDRAAIFLEIHAEASRNPKIAAVLAELDRNFRGLMKELITRARRTRPGTPDIPDAKMELILLMLHGIAARITINPDIDPQVLMEGFEKVALSVLAPETLCAEPAAPRAS